MKTAYFSKTNFYITAILIVPVIIFGFVRQMEKHESLPFYNIAKNLEAQEFHFQDQNKITKSFKELNGKILLVDFFFTSCPVICPKMTRGLKTIASKFEKEPSIKLLSFSVDPIRDSSAKLLKYISKMNASFPSWSFLTGDKKAIYKLARKEFFVTATDGDGGPEDFIHTDKIILLDINKNIRGYYDGTSPTEINQLIKDIKKLQHES